MAFTLRWFSTVQGKVHAGRARYYFKRGFMKMDEIHRDFVIRSIERNCGINSKDGRKDDDRKPPVYQGVINYFPRALLEIAKVSDFGAKKYSWGNWKIVPDGIARYGDAQMRHACYSQTVMHDDESGLLHTAHEAWCALAKLELMLIERDKQDV